MNRSKLYDLIYDKADKLFKRYNPCNIRFEKPNLFGDKIIQCKLFEYKNCRTGLCCQGCDYLGELGCTVKSVGCKTGLCNGSTNIDRALSYFDSYYKRLDAPLPMKKELRKLCRLAHKYNFIGGGRKSKEDIFKENQLQLIERKLGR